MSEQQRERELRACDAGLACCHVCGKLSPLRISVCPRCGEETHLRKPYSIQRAWAYLFAAIILYLPSMLFPIMEAEGLTDNSSKTVVAGAIEFWNEGSYPVALVILIASVLIPITKMLVLIFLLLSVQFKSTLDPARRTSIYRMTELVGRWSMVDVFVVAVMVALIQMGNLIQVKPGPAAIAFACVVILTMLSAMAFDPRLIWDKFENTQSKS